MCKWSRIRLPIQKMQHNILKNVFRRNSKDAGMQFVESILAPFSTTKAKPVFYSIAIMLAFLSGSSVDQSQLDSFNIIPSKQQSLQTFGKKNETIFGYIRNNLKQYINSLLIHQLPHSLSVKIRIILFFAMTEQQMISDFNDQKMLTTQGEESGFKLPRLQQHAIRAQVRSKAEHRRNSPPLPSLKKNAASQFQVGSNNNHGKNSLGNERGFTLEIEQKLKQVLENVNQGERVSQEDLEIDFEKVIEQNKQKIKQHKLKNDNKQQKGSKPPSRQQKKSAKRREQTVKNLNKHDGNYEKRIKQMSLQNKYLQKKKELIAQKQEAIQKAKAVAKQRQSMPLRHGSSIPFPVRYVGRSKESPPKNSPKKQIHKPQQQQPINNLFDNLHNLLQNPLKSRVQSSFQTHQNIGALQAKLKNINQKLGVSEAHQNQIKSQQSIGIANYTILDWKRWVFTDSNNFKCYQDSNFQKQIDKISKLQQKNENILNEYLDHQKDLVNLKLMKRLMEQQKETNKTS